MKFLRLLISSFLGYQKLADFFVRKIWSRIYYYLNIGQFYEVEELPIFLVKIAKEAEQNFTYQLSKWVIFCISRMIFPCSMIQVTKNCHQPISFSKENMFFEDYFLEARCQMFLLTDFFHM